MDLKIKHGNSDIIIPLLEEKLGGGRTPLFTRKKGR